MAGTQDSRIKIKRSTTAAEVPTVPASEDHTDGTWIATDIYKGELFLNIPDGKLYTRTDDGIVQISMGGTEGVVYEASLDIASIDVQTLNSAPLTIVEAPGAGKAVEILHAATSITFTTAAYATNTNLILITDTANIAQVSDPEILKSTVSRTLKAHVVSDLSGITTSDTILVADKRVMVSVQTGDPSTGDSDIKVRVLYRIITL